MYHIRVGRALGLVVIHILRLLHRVELLGKLGLLLHHERLLLLLLRHHVELLITKLIVVLISLLIEISLLVQISLVLIVYSSRCDTKWVKT